MLAFRVSFGIRPFGQILFLSGALPLMYPAAPGLSPADRPSPFALMRSSQEIDVRGIVREHTFSAVRAEASQAGEAKRHQITAFKQALQSLRQIPRETRRGRGIHRQHGSDPRNVGWPCSHSRRGRLHRHQAGRVLGSAGFTCLFLRERQGPQRSRPFIS